MQEEEGSAPSEGEKEIRAKKPNNRLNFLADDTRADDDKPDCDASKPGYDDYIVFKTAMKRYTKTHPDPGSISMLNYYRLTILKENAVY